MCFAPQLRALCRHLNVQKCSDAEVLLALWLRHALRAAVTCNFWSLIRPDGSAPAALASLRGHKTSEKHNVSRLFYLIARFDLLSSCSLFSHSSHLCCFILSEVWFLNFLRALTSPFFNGLAARVSPIMAWRWKAWPSERSALKGSASSRDSQISQSLQMMVG